MICKFSLVCVCVGFPGQPGTAGLDGVPGLEGQKGEPGTAGPGGRGIPLVPRGTQVCRATLVWMVRGVSGVHQEIRVCQENQAQR